MREVLSDSMFYVVVVLPIIGVIVGSIYSRRVRAILPFIALGLAILSLMGTRCHATCTWDKASYVLIVGPHTTAADIGSGWQGPDGQTYYDNMGIDIYDSEPDLFEVLYFYNKADLGDYLSRHNVSGAVLIDVHCGPITHIHQTQITEPDTTITTRVKGYKWEAK